MRHEDEESKAGNIIRQMKESNCACVRMNANGRNRTVVREALMDPSSKMRMKRRQRGRETHGTSKLKSLFVNGKSTLQVVAIVRALYYCYYNSPFIGRFLA